MPTRRCLAITGASGFVGGHAAAVAAGAGWRVVNMSRTHPAGVAGEWSPVDITDRMAVLDAVSQVRPTVVLHAAAIANIDLAEREREIAWRVNVVGTEHVVSAAAGVGARLIALSTENVFDGERGDYVENDKPRPVNFYGETKVAAEDACRRLHPEPLIVRLAMVYGRSRTGGITFLDRVADAARRGEPIEAPGEEYRTPIDVRTAADALVELAAGEQTGVLHLGGTERVSRVRFVQKILQELGADPGLVREGPASGFPDRARRPRDVSVRTDRARAWLRTPLLDLRAGLRRALS